MAEPKINRLDEKRTMTASLGALSFISNCMSHRGGVHPGEQKKLERFYLEAQDAVIEAITTKLPPTCMDQIPESLKCDNHLTRCD